MEKNTFITHPRYRNIPAPTAAAFAAHQGDPTHLAVVLFKHGSRLRSHAVKHYANINELEATSFLLSRPIETIIKRVDAIRDLGCPFFLYNSGTPPCWQGGNYCPLFNQCGETGGRELESDYLHLCMKAIEDAIDRPRCAAIRERCPDGDTHMYHMLSDSSITLRFKWEEAVYNLKSCFVPQVSGKGKWQQTLESVRSSIIRKASGRIHWITPETWEMSVTRERQEKTRENRSPKKKSFKPYRGGSGNWRQYLDGMDS